MTLEVSPQNRVECTGHPLQLSTEGQAQGPRAKKARRASDGIAPNVGR